MVSPNQIRAYSLRPEEIVAESARERLIAQASRQSVISEAYQRPNAARGAILNATAVYVLTALAVIAGWFTWLG